MNQDTKIAELMKQRDRAREEYLTAQSEKLEADRRASVATERMNAARKKFVDASAQLPALIAADCSGVLGSDAKPILETAAAQLDGAAAGAGG